jgi:hypothetical protein
MSFVRIDRKRIWWPTTIRITYRINAKDSDLPAFP